MPIIVENSRIEKTGQKLSTRHQLRLKEFIDSSLDNDLSIEKMALLLGISPSHFSSLFRATFGVSPHQYVLRKRIDKAAHLLRTEPERSIMDIAIETGFSSQAHLTYSFKRVMKQTPGRWKKWLKQTSNHQFKNLTQLHQAIFHTISTVFQ